MERKLVKQGNNALTVSLPYRWILRNRLQKGENISVEEQGNDLLLSKVSNNIKKKYVLEISKEKPFFKRYLRSCYVMGYDEVEIVSEDKLPYNKIEESISTLMGYEILLHKTKICKIGILSIGNNENLDVLVNKLFFMVQMMFDDISEALAQDDIEEILEISKIEKSTNSFVDFCLRVLNKEGSSNYEKTQYIYHVLVLLEEIADSLRNFCLNLVKKNKSNLDLLENLKIYFSKILKIYLNYNMQEIKEIKKIRLLIFDLFKKDSIIFSLSVMDLYVVLNLLHQLEVLIDPIKI